MPSITQLPTLVASLPAEKRARFERLFRLDMSEGYCVLPDTMREWTIKHFGSTEAVEYQHILRITNLWTWEGAIYNPLRSGRPLVNHQSPIPNHQNDDLFAHPLQTTAADVFGRVRGQHCITTGNIARWEGQHAVLIFDEFDPLKFTREHMRDYFATSLAWANKAHAQDPQARYFVWTWNGGLKGGASIPHAHAQLALARDMHYGRIEQLRRAALAYQHQFGANYFEDVLGAHQDVGLSFQAAGLPGLLYLTALRAKDTWVIGKAFDEQLADALCDTLHNLIEKTGTGAFNVGVMMPPLLSPLSSGRGVASDARGEGWHGFPVIARIVDRGSPAMLSSDVGALDVFAHQVIAVDPFEVIRDW
jgi:hypothetical protein